MTRIFDNIEQDLLTTLRGSMQVSTRADFCVGYLNLRGWQAVDDLVQPWNPDEGQVCRVLVGIDLKRWRRSVSFARFEAKVLGLQ